eukprot:scaffold8083_cov18-Tisochrysis_lutea.AAC.1
MEFLILCSLVLFVQSLATCVLGWPIPCNLTQLGQRPHYVSPSVLVADTIVWDRVAEKVPGKSKVDCFKRFKELREMFGKKKSCTGCSARSMGLVQQQCRPEGRRVKEIGVLFVLKKKYICIWLLLPGPWDSFILDLARTSFCDDIAFKRWRALEVPQECLKSGCLTARLNQIEKRTGKGANCARSVQELALRTGSELRAS